MFRTFSDQTRHVKLYDGSELESGIGEWYFQPYIPTLITAGEVRVVVANGSAMVTAFTRPHQGLDPDAALDIETLIKVRPLKDMEHL